MRTITAYLIGVLVTLAILNGVVWETGNPARLHNFAIFSAGFLLGAFAMYLAAHVYGYRKAQ